ncbi:MAG: adenylate/guanylate cyclase domain-containing protein [Betaproteobacteria bacterium]|jgi:adenylate cyclase|nr:adenylate/guanylate cyclase domain-containing protein [Betaproteobacteria bacterium]
MLAKTRAWLNSMGERVITEQDSEQDRLNKTLLIFACGLMGFGSILWLALYWAMGIKFSSTVPLAYLAISAASLACYIYTRNFELFRTLQVSLFLFVPFVMQWSIGSYVSSSGVALWALLAPVGVMIFQGARQSLPWFVAYIVLTVVSGFFDYWLTPGLESGVTMQGIAVFFTLNFAAMSTIMYLLISFFVRQRDRLQATVDERNRLLRVEQEKSDALLLNILPAPIARRLKDSQGVIADGFADVTVMFADIVDFTRISAELPPQAVVELLNEVFSEFDALAERHGLEKIKTVGDAYMVAGGLLEHDGVNFAVDARDYSGETLHLALEMREYMRLLSSKRGMNLSIHIGICSGPVVAGVIGTRKFIYDIWGDTVNTASRISDEARSGIILVDAVTYQRSRQQFEFEGPLNVVGKGKGNMRVYRLNDVAQHLRPVTV